MKLPDKAYDVLKWVALIALPALATFYGVVAPLWELPYPDKVVTTINAVGVLIGALIGISSYTISSAESEADDDAE